MSDAEKLVEAGVKYPDDPLILRPPVGGDILRTHPGGRYCWPRSFILRLILICVVLATIAGCILIIFTLHHSGAWPWFSSRHFGYHDGVSASGSCRVFTPLPDFGVEERFIYEPNAITITHGPVAGFPAVSIFHLLKEDMSVMRTHGICYIYPLDPEVAEAAPVDDPFLERIRGANNDGMVQFKSSFGMRVYMVLPNGDQRIQIAHPAAAANCSDVPIFRLIEMVLSQAGAQLDPSSESAMSPVICSKECPLGESRDGLGIPRQVCRCPPKATPPAMNVPVGVENLLPPAFNEDKPKDTVVVGGPVPVEPQQEKKHEIEVEIQPFDEDDDLMKPGGLAKVLDVSPNLLTPPDDNPIELLNDIKPFDQSNPISDVDNETDDSDEDLDDDQDDDIVVDFASKFEEANAWIPEGDELTRRQRAAEVLNNLEPPIKIPADCHVVDKVLEGAVPNAVNHTLSLMTVVQC